MDIPIFYPSHPGKPRYEIPIHHDLPSPTPEQSAHQQQLILRAQTRYYSRSLLNKINPATFTNSESLSVSPDALPMSTQTRASSMGDLPNIHAITPSSLASKATQSLSSPVTLPPINYQAYINSHPLTAILTDSKADPSAQPSSSLNPADHPKIHQDRLPEHLLYSPIPEGMTVYPSHEEFADPNAYIRSLTQHAYSHGIIRIVPPAGFHCDFQLDADTYTFRATKQIIGRFGKGGRSMPGRYWTLSSYMEAAQQMEREFYLKENARMLQKVDQHVQPPPYQWEVGSSSQLRLPNPFEDSSVEIEQSHGRGNLENTSHTGSRFNRNKKPLPSELDPLLSSRQPSHPFPQPIPPGETPILPTGPQSISMSAYPSPPPADIEYIRKTLLKQDVVQREHQLRILVNQKQHFLAARQYHRQNQLFGSKSHFATHTKRVTRHRGQSKRSKANAKSRKQPVGSSRSRSQSRSQSQRRRMYFKLFGKRIPIPWRGSSTISSQSNNPPATLSTTPVIHKSEWNTRYDEEKLADITPYIDMNVPDRRHPHIKQIVSKPGAHEAPATLTQTSQLSQSSKAGRRHHTSGEEAVVYLSDMADEDIVNYQVENNDQLIPVAKSRRVKKPTNRIMLSTVDAGIPTYFKTRMKYLGRLPRKMSIPIYARRDIRKTILTSLLSSSGGASDPTVCQFPDLYTTEFHDVLSYQANPRNLTSHNNIAEKEAMRGRTVPQHTIHEDPLLNVIPVSVRTLPYHVDHEQFVTSHWLLHSSNKKNDESKKRSLFVKHRRLRKTMVDLSAIQGGVLSQSSNQRVNSRSSRSTSANPQRHQIHGTESTKHPHTSHRGPLTPGQIYWGRRVVLLGHLLYRLQLLNEKQTTTRLSSVDSLSTSLQGSGTSYAALLTGPNAQGLPEPPLNYSVQPSFLQSRTFFPIRTRNHQHNETSHDSHLSLHANMESPTPGTTLATSSSFSLEVPSPLSSFESIASPESTSTQRTTVSSHPSVSFQSQNQLPIATYLYPNLMGIAKLCFHIRSHLTTLPANTTSPLWMGTPPTLARTTTNPVQRLVSAVAYLSLHARSTSSREGMHPEADSNRRTPVATRQTASNQTPTSHIKYRLIPFITSPTVLEAISQFFHRMFSVNFVRRRLHAIRQNLVAHIPSSEQFALETGTTSMGVLLSTMGLAAISRTFGNHSFQPTLIPSMAPANLLDSDNNEDHTTSGLNDQLDDENTGDDDVTTVKSVKTTHSISPSELYHHLTHHEPHSLDDFHPTVQTSTSSLTVSEHNPNYAQPFSQYYSNKESLEHAIQLLTQSIIQNIESIPENLNEVMSHITMALIHMNLLAIPHPQMSSVVSLYFPPTRRSSYGMPGPMWAKRFIAANEQKRVQMIEEYYWTALIKQTHEIDIEYAKDLNTRRHAAYPHPFWTQYYPYKPHQASLSSSSPPGSSSQLDPSSLPPMYDLWNPHILPFIHGSLLSHIGLTSGITNPWLYIAGLFSSFPWHIEDDYFYSLSTNVTNSPKVWYGIANSDADLFEALFGRCIDQGLTSIHSLANIVSPQLLKAYGIQVSKLVQHPGEFILTVPRGYHCGFSLGLSIAEAVNMALDTWVPYGRLASIKYRYENNRESVIALEYLLFAAIIQFANEVIESEIEFKSSIPGISWHQESPSVYSLAHANADDIMKILKASQNTISSQIDFAFDSFSSQSAQSGLYSGLDALPPENTPPVSTGVFPVGESVTSLLTVIAEKQRTVLSKDLFVGLADLVQDEIDVYQCFTGHTIPTPIAGLPPMQRHLYSKSRGSVYLQYYRYLSQFHDSHEDPESFPHITLNYDQAKNGPYEFYTRTFEIMAQRQLFQQQQQQQQQHQQQQQSLRYRPLFVHWNDCDLMLLFNIPHRQYDDLFIPTCIQCAQYCFTSFSTCHSLLVLASYFRTIERVYRVYDSRLDMQRKNDSDSTPASSFDAVRNDIADIYQDSANLQPLLPIVRDTRGFCAYGRKGDIYHLINECNIHAPYLESGSGSSQEGGVLVNDAYFEGPAHRMPQGNNYNFGRLKGSRDGVFACQYHTQFAKCACHLVLGDAPAGTPCRMPVLFHRFTPLLLKQFQIQNFPHLVDLT